MEIKKIQYCLMLARTLNFRQAAEKLYITPQALSKQIRQLEEELGVPLFVRTTKTVALTQAGQVFVEKFEKVEAAYQTAQSEFQAQVKRLPASLRVGFFNGMNHAGAVSPVVSFLSDFLPGTDIMVQSSPLGELKGKLMSDYYDLTVTLIHERELWEGCRILAMEQIPVEIVVSRRHPWAIKPGLGPDDLRDGTLLLLELDESEFISGSIYGDIRCRETRRVQDVDSLMITLAVGTSFAILPTGFHQIDPVLYKTFELPADYRFSFYGACIYKQSSPWRSQLDQLTSLTAFPIREGTLRDSP